MQIIKSERWYVTYQGDDTTCLSEHAYNCTVRASPQSEFVHGGKWRDVKNCEALLQSCAPYKSYSIGWSSGFMVIRGYKSCCDEDFS